MMSEMQLLGDLIGAGINVLDRMKSRQEERRRQRLELLQRIAEKRISKLEAKIEQVMSSPEDVDLFTSVIEALIKDDETANVPYYAAILERQLEGTSHRERLRRLVVAFKALSAKELGLLAVHDPKRVLPGHDDDWISVGLPARLAYSGLYNSSTGVVHGSRFTAIGQLAIETAKSAQQAVEL